MKYVKAFISGMAFPSFLFPFLFFLTWSFGKARIFEHPFPHFIPLMWGIWNILYFAFFDKVLPLSLNTKLLITGGVLGFLIAMYGVFWLNVPKQIGFPESVTYLPLLLGPIFYAILWVFIVKPLNRLLGLFSSYSS